MDLCRRIDTNLILEDGLPVAVHLVLFGTVVLDGFEVQQRIDAASLLLVIGQVHTALELGTPLGYHDGGHCEIGKEEINYIYCKYDSSMLLVKNSCEKYLKESLEKIQEESWGNT